MGHALRDAFGDEDLAALGRELVRFGARTALRWGLDPHHLPGGLTVLDIVQTAFADVIDGKVPWSPARGPVVAFLKVRTRRLLWALAAESGVRKYEVRRDDTDPAAATDARTDPESLLVGEEQRAAALAWRNALFLAVGEEPELEAVLAVIEGGERRPRKIAEALDVSSDEVYRRLKRLRRRARDLDAERLP